MNYSAFFAATSLIGLASCSSHELEQTCGRPLEPGGNQCCAVGTQDFENNFIAQNFSCRASDNACKDEATTSVYPYHRFPWQPDQKYKGNSAFEGGCAPVRWRKVDVFSSTSSTLSLAPSTASGIFVPIDQPLNCLERCNYDFPNSTGGGNPALCPSINIEPSVASALFFFYSDLDPRNYPLPENSIPIKEILQKFEVPQDDLGSCPRNDVTVFSNGKVVNEGSSCPAFSSFKIQGQEVDSELGISERLTGQFESNNQNEALMIYSEMSETFELSHSQPAYNTLYGGKIRKSARLFDAAVAEIHNRQNLKTCARSNSQFRLSAEESFLLQEASTEEISNLLDVALKSLQKALEVGENHTPEQKFRPLQTALSSLNKEETDNLLRSLSATLSATEHHVAAEDLLIPLMKWADASICNSALYIDGLIQTEFANGYRVDLLLDENADKKRLASTEFLRCVSAHAFASESFSEAISGLFGGSE